MSRIINLQSAKKPNFNEAQREFAKSLIGMGLARITITALVLGKDASNLNHSEVTSGHGLINKLYKELGYSISDARHARTPYMKSAVTQVASGMRLKIKIA